MKKRFFALAAFFTFLIFSFVSCTQLVEEESYSNQRTVKANVSAADSIFSSSSSSRTIMTAITEVSESAYDFYIEGENLSVKNSDGIPLQKITIHPTNASGSEGYFTFNFEPNYYRLTLYTVPENTAITDVFNNKIIMQSSVAVDLRTCDEINFYLSSYNVYGSGDYNLALYADGWTPQNMTINAKIISKNLNNKDYVERSEILAIFPTSPETPTYQWSSLGDTARKLTAGTYLLRVIFTDINTGSVYYYEDELIIFANQTVRQEIPIPDITQIKPAAPGYLIAGYVDSASEDEKYYVEFCWQDSSYNESYFQLELLDIRTFCEWDSYSHTGYEDYHIEDILTDFTAGVQAANTNTYGNTVYNYLQNAVVYNPSTPSNKIVAGSFDEGSTYAVLKLDYGTNYIARIKAVNYAGSSSYTYIDLQNTGNNSFASDINGSAPSNWTSGSSGLSRYKVTYELNSGLFYNNAGGSEVNVNAAVVNSGASSAFPLAVYKSQMISGSFTAASPSSVVYSGGTASLKYLDSSENPEVYRNFDKWTLDYEGGTTFSSTMGYKNLYLVANYSGVESTTSSSFVLRKDGVDLLDADIVFTAHASDAETDITGKFLPFKSDTEDTGGTKIYFNDAGEVAFSTTNYRYANFLFNTTRTGISDVSFKVYKKGGHAESLTASPDLIGWYSDYYKYVQIDLSAVDSESGEPLYEAGNTYCVDYLITNNGITSIYTVYFILE